MSAAVRLDDTAIGIAHEAVAVVIKTQFGSTSFMQRKLRIGFAMAGAVAEILEAAGVLASATGSLAREVLMTDEAAAHAAVDALVEAAS